RLPGLPDMLKARVGGELFVLEPGATARGALARIRESAARGSAVSLRRQLPWDQAGLEVDRDETARVHAGLPRHVPDGSRPCAIAAPPPRVIASQVVDGAPVIGLGTDMRGISRRHCSTSLRSGQCVLEDHSRYGTFLSGHRIDGSTVLQ